MYRISKRKFIIGMSLCVLGIIILLGSLFTSALTDDAVWFVFGYPVAFICLVISLFLYKKN